MRGAFGSRKKGTERKPSAGSKRLALPRFKRRLHTGNRRLHGWNERSAALSVSKERNRQKKGTERKPSAVQSGLRCRGSNDGSKRGTDVCTGGMNGARRFRSRKKGTERKPSAGAKRLALPWFKRRIQTGNHRLHGWNERCAALSVSKERNRQKKGTERKPSAGPKRFSICAFHTKTVSPERPLRAAPRRAAATVG